MKPLLYENELLDEFKRQMSNADRFALAMALMSQGGLDSVQDLLRVRLERGCVGRVLVGVDMPTEPDAIESLLTLRKQFSDQFSVRVFKSSKGRIFHAKFAIFERQNRLTAILGSSNLTHGGLAENYEANVLITEPAVVRKLVDYFEEHFEGGRSKRITEEWLGSYREVWRQRRMAVEALRRARDRVRRIHQEQVDGSKPPKRIKGHTFCFTGKIPEWPRETRLYPKLKRWGGGVAKTADNMKLADCLVHGDILGGRKSTRKLVRARATGVPIINEEEFFKILDHEKSLRKRGQ